MLLRANLLVTCLLRSCLFELGWVLYGRMTWRCESLRRRSLHLALKALTVLTGLTLVYNVCISAAPFVFRSFVIMTSPCVSIVVCRKDVVIGASTRCLMRLLRATLTSWRCWTMIEGCGAIYVVVVRCELLLSCRRSWGRVLENFWVPILEWEVRKIRKLTNLLLELVIGGLLISDLLTSLRSMPLRLVTTTPLILLPLIKGRRCFSWNSELNIVWVSLLRRVVGYVAPLVPI